MTKKNKHTVALGRLGGSKTSARKAESSRRNGRLRRAKKQDLTDEKQSA